MLNVLIIEDEFPAANRLAKMIADIAPDFEVVQYCDSVESSVRLLKSHKPDLIFLDIQLGDGVSFEIFNAVKVHCPVIFTTAYDEFVFRAFELNSIDYLLKPIEKERLEKSIQKFRQWQLPQNTNWQFLQNLFTEKKSVAYKERFLVNAGSNLISVQTQEIAYFYSTEKITFFTCFSGKTYSVELSLDKVESVVSEKDFFRINRQFLVSIKSIKKISVLSKSRIKIQLTPECNEEIFVSNQRAPEFRKWLDG